MSETIVLELSPQTLALMNQIASTAPSLIREAQTAGLTMGKTLFRNEAVEKAPVDTNNLRRNIKTSQTADEARIYVDPSVEYAVYQEFGTRPHIIQVKVKKVLADKKRGIIFGRIVHHPGFKGRFYMKAGADKVLANSQSIQATIYNTIRKGLGL